MLNKIDYKILEYISKYDKVYIDDILKEYPKDETATPERLKIFVRYNLLDKEYISRDEQNNHLEKVQIFFSITEEGEVALLDANIIYWKDWHDTILRSFIFPSLVAIITAFVTSLITVKFIK